MQATAMGESLYLAFFIWAVLYFAEAARGHSKSLTNCGFCLAAACLTRYDGWFLAASMAGVAVLMAVVKPGERKMALFSRIQVGKFILIAAAAPALWLVYNGIVYRNPLEFANGPYSAKAIEKKTQNAGNPGHPGSGNPWLAELYFVKSAEANVATNEWVQRVWLLLLGAGLGVILRLGRSGPAAGTSAWPLGFLLVPLPFFIPFSVAYSGVPIFIPYWWPFTDCNVRY